MSYDRDLIRSVAEPVVLKLVAERPMYGYEIIKVVNDRTDGAFAWKEGTLYPCLHRLESSGLIRSEWQVQDNGRNRKYYSISRKGQGVLKKRSDEWAAFSACVQALLFAPVPTRA